MTDMIYKISVSILCQILISWTYPGESVQRNFLATADRFESCIKSTISGKSTVMKVSKNISKIS